MDSIRPIKKLKSINIRSSKKGTDRTYKFQKSRTLSFIATRFNLKWINNIEPT